jgi:hypothetical protein
MAVKALLVESFQLFLRLSRPLLDDTFKSLLRRLLCCRRVSRALCRSLRPSRTFETFVTIPHGRRFLQLPVVVAYVDGIARVHHKQRSLDDPSKDCQCSCLVPILDFLSWPRSRHSLCQLFHLFEIKSCSCAGLGMVAQSLLFKSRIGLVRQHGSNPLSEAVWLSPAHDHPRQCRLRKRVRIHQSRSRTRQFVAHSRPRLEPRAGGANRAHDAKSRRDFSTARNSLDQLLQVANHLTVGHLYLKSKYSQRRVAMLGGHLGRSPWRR